MVDVGWWVVGGGSYVAGLTATLPMFAMGVEVADCAALEGFSVSAVDAMLLCVIIDVTFSSTPRRPQVSSRVNAIRN